MVAKCSACAFENPDGFRFCGMCGTRLESNDAQVLPPTVPHGPMVGEELMERLRNAGIEARGQRRNVTVLFTDITGFTSLSTRTDSEDLYEVIRKYTQALAESVYKFDGVVDKFTGDGLMALFGAPIAHENNAELAVRCVIDMFSQLEHIHEEVIKHIGVPLRVRIGLNTGLVTVGGIGSDKLMNYTAIGDTVNLAQRLMDAVEPGHLMVSQSVYNATHRLFDYEQVPDLKLKGFSEPVTGYRFVSVKEKPQSVRGLEGLRAPMVGRDHELKRLGRALEILLQRRRGQLAILQGEGGIGKSRMVAEFKQLAAENPVTLLQGSSLTYRRNVAYWIFQDMLRSHMGISADAPAEEISSSLKQSCEDLLASKAFEIFPFLEMLLGQKPSDSTQAQRINLLDASQLRQQVFLAVRTWLVAQASRQPVILALDDLHWADDPSLDLLNYLLPLLNQHPIFLLIISRPVEDGRLQKIIDWSEANNPGSSILVSLQNLSPSESQTLLNRLIPIANPPESLVDRIIRQSAGIPFYLEEILRMMIDQGTLVEKESGWEIAQQINPDDIGVPSTLEGLILARFDRLPPLNRRVLQVSSVIGRQFGQPILASVLSQEANQIPELLERLVQQGYVILESEFPTLMYSFRNTIVSDAIYHTLIRRDRNDLHTRVGEAIEHVYQGQLDNQSEILARHFSWGGQPARALPYVIQSAHKAARSYLNEQARVYFQEALEILETQEHDPEQEAEIHYGLGQVLLLTGDYQEARQRFERSLELYKCKSETSEHLSAVYRGLATAYERQGDYDQALEFLGTAQNCVPPASLGEKALILNDIGWIHFRRGENEAAQNMLQQALTMSEQTVRIDVTASILNRLGGVSWQMDRLSQASEYVQRSLALRQEIGDTVALARSYNNLSLLNWIQGYWDAALDNLGRCLELNGSLGDVEGVIMAQTNLGLIHMERGDLDKARYHLQEALSEAESIGHNYNIANSCQNFCQLYNLSGEWENAKSYGERSIKIYEELGARQEVATVYTLMGSAELGMDRLGEAEAWARRSQALQTAILEESGKEETDTHGRNLRLMGQIHLERGELDMAKQSLEESSAVFSRLNNRIENARTLAVLAQTVRQMGNAQDAEKFCHEANETFTQLGAALDKKRLESTR